MCDIHTRQDPTFLNCPLPCPTATELNCYNGDEWEARGEKGQGGGGVAATATRTSTPHPLLSFSLKYTPRKTQTDTSHLPGC